MDINSIFNIIKAMSPKQEESKPQDAISSVLSMLKDRNPAQNASETPFTSKNAGATPFISQNGIGQRSDFDKPQKATDASLISSLLPMLMNGMQKSNPKPSSDLAQAANMRDANVQIKNDDNIKTTPSENPLQDENQHETLRERCVARAQDGQEHNDKRSALCDDPSNATKPDYGTNHAQAGTNYQTSAAQTRTNHSPSDSSKGRASVLNKADFFSPVQFAGYVLLSALCKLYLAKSPV